jgi:hypothetical protein
VPIYPLVTTVSLTAARWRLGGRDGTFGRGDAARAGGFTTKDTKGWWIIVELRSRLHGALVSFVTFVVESLLSDSARL